MRSANNLAIYSDYASQWWEEGSPFFRSLQNITPFRLSLINEWSGEVGGKDVIDLGCGGGLLSIPLIKLGARVTGVDQSEPSLKVARHESLKDINGVGKFVRADIRKVPLLDNSADLVLLADVLDHIPEYNIVLKEASRLTRPGGSLFIGTINRNLLSWFFAIFLGEGLRLIPPGTHDYKLFIKPLELLRHAKEAGLELVAVQGEWPKIFDSLRKGAITLRKSRSLLVAYSMFFKKV